MVAEQRNAWIALAVAVIGYAVYFSLVMGAAAGGPLAEADYITPMLIVIIGSVIGTVVLTVAVAIIAQAADELMLTIRAAARVIDEGAIPVAMSGRAVAAGSALHDALVARIEADAAIELLDSAGTPLDGALRLAIDGEGHPYGDAITRWRRPE